jgi:hypothetical protein
MRKSASATKDASTPITMASPAIGTTRRVVVKSPSSLGALGGRPERPFPFDI